MNLRSKLVAGVAALGLAIGVAATAAPASAAVIAVNLDSVHQAQASMVTLQGSVANAFSGGVNVNSVNEATADALNNVQSVTKDTNVDGGLFALNASDVVNTQVSALTAQLASATATATSGVQNSSRQSASALAGNNLQVTDLKIAVH